MLYLAIILASILHVIITILMLMKPMEGIFEDCKRRMRREPEYLQLDYKDDYNRLEPI